MALFSRCTAGRGRGSGDCVATEGATGASCLGLIRFFDGVGGGLGNGNWVEAGAGSAAGMGGARDTTVSTAGSEAVGNSGRPFGVLFGVMFKGSAAGDGFGRISTRRSGTSARRSCQGRLKPGSPRPRPAKVRLNSAA